MKKWMLVIGLTFLLCGTAEAAITDWPVVGQVSRVGVCLVKGSGTLLASLVAHLSAFGVEVVAKIGECAKAVVGNTEEVATGAVTLTLPTPSTVEEIHVGETVTPD